jgi:hypothetical protein
VVLSVLENDVVIEAVIYLAGIY